MHMYVSEKCLSCFKAQW